MTKIGAKELVTQKRIISFFQKTLGYDYLGNWEERPNNSNIEEVHLHIFLSKSYSEALVKKALFEFKKVASDQSKDLYQINKEVYTQLRYGIKLREEHGENKQTIWLIDWENPEANHFAIAEEVTLKGENDKRPDLVLYVNGIALGVLELKRGKVSIEKGIRQNYDNQKEQFIRHFFSTMQLVMAGNDTQGIRYGTIETKAKYYLQWKEESTKKYDYLLEKHLTQICNKSRFLEIIRDFILFDAGIKKICRPHQYFGVDACKAFIQKREGGIIWHTQGSGKSLTMVWLAKWIIENKDDSRVLIITDRDELDKQIVRVFGDAGETMVRAKSGADLIDKLNKNENPLLCTLVHKFGRKEEGDYTSFIEEIQYSLPKDFKAKGDIYVFVDECHRTQSGKLHQAMKKILPEALFIGFTGTPLLKKDKLKSIEVFGPYIHTYKFNEAVADEVVLDLRYEARDIDQKITDQGSIDEWFDAETKGLTDVAKVELKKRWGTMQKVLSSRSRLEKIVFDVVKDFKTRPRLSTGEGNAILVSGSVYQACKYYELFQNFGFKECAIITSYEPHISDIKGEDAGEGETENIQKYEIYQRMLKGKTTEQFEEETKELFRSAPARMKLLIVVDKLLTGFDAPPASYLYIDKKMQDHGLFQAICRVNRLDNESKEYGYIIDYKDLFKSLEKSIDDYTSEAFDQYEQSDVEGLLQDRLQAGKERLDASLEAIIALCEPVYPQDSKHFIRYFCGDTENEADLKENEEKRIALYKMTVSLIRAFTNIANEILAAGYTKEEAESIHQKVKFYTDLRDSIKLASGEKIDLKSYEAGMRQLIDMYISADASRKISAFEDTTLLELIVEQGEDALGHLPNGIRKDKSAVAEVIENNLRKVIIEEKPTNPKYFERMSELLTELIQNRKQAAIEYEAYLKKFIELTRKVKAPQQSKSYPKELDSNAKRALYDNLDEDKDLAVLLDAQVNYVKEDGWKEHPLKSKAVKKAIEKILPKKYDIEGVFEIIKQQHDYDD